MMIASVRHTGTRFLKVLLKQHEPTENVHFGQNFLYRLQGHYVITPLRRLDRVIQSWVNRSMELDMLHRDIGIMLEHPVDFFFPIDSENREDYLRELSEILGTELKTDWMPTGHHGKGQPNNEPEWTERILNDYSGFFDKFYKSV